MRTFRQMARDFFTWAKHFVRRQTLCLVRTLTALTIASSTSALAWDCGGGGDANGVDILPGWLVRWLDERDIDPCEIIAQISEEGGYQGITITITGPGVDLKATIGPDGPTGNGEASLPTVLVTGTIDGWAINSSGWLIPQADGRFRPANGDMTGFCMPVREFDDGWDFVGRWKLDPTTLGDGDPHDDVNGGVSVPDAQRGLMGTRVTTN